MTPRHLLVTNDYPPKIGGIQNYLWELWRRLPAERVGVYTTPYPGAEAFDREQRYSIRRSPEPVLLPYPWLRSRLASLPTHAAADLVILDPALPLGAIGPLLDRPYAVVLHGAEVVIPGRTPGLATLFGAVVSRSRLVVSAGAYPLAEAERSVGRPLPSVVVPPGVDHQRFTPAPTRRRQQLRATMNLADDDILVASVSRLVPRKGMEALIRAVALLNRRRSVQRPAPPRIVARIAGSGRDERRLARLIGELGAPVELLGRVDDDAVVELYQAADLMAMLCNQRWFGLEQEGFGIVFLEAAACGLAQVAGRSGGAHEAVVHGRTGLVVDQPTEVEAVAAAIEELADDPCLRHEMGRQARARVVAEFDYDLLAERLLRSLDAAVSTAGR